MSPQQPAVPTRNFEDFFRHVKSIGFDPKICIDVGAGNGTGVIYEAFRQALHIAFEPLPDFHERLAKRLENFDHEIHQCALMDKDDTLEILRMEKNLYGSTLMHRRKDGDQALVRVPVKRLDDIMAGRWKNGPLLLKTDCQGADLTVIKGAPETLQHCEIVIMEVSFFSFWGDHHPEFFEIVSFMNDRGFVVYDFLDGLFRPSDNALGQIDVAFVKKDGMFRKSRAW